MADVQLRAVALARRIGHREIAALAVVEDEIEVLAGLELDADAGGKAQMHQHDVVGELLQAEHPRVDGLARERIGLADRARRDDEIGARPRVAEQHLALGALGRAQRIAGEGAHLAGDDAALAGAADALAAGVGDFEAGALRGVEHGFVRLAGKAEFGVLDGRR